MGSWEKIWRERLRRGAGGEVSREMVCGAGNVEMLCLAMSNRCLIWRRTEGWLFEKVRMRCVR